MKQKVIIVTDKWEGDQTIPEAYVIGTDSGADGESRAAAILGMLYKGYLKTEIDDSAIPVDLAGSFLDEEAGYAQVKWTNGDLHCYHLVDASDVPGMEEYATKRKEPDMDQDDTTWSGRVMSLSTVHIVPEAVDFLAEARDSDALQVFPNSDSCVMHVTDVDAALGYGLPLCVKDCVRYAWKNGCPWIYFGYEGKEREGLPTYRAKWDKII